MIKCKVLDSLDFRTPICDDFESRVCYTYNYDMCREHYHIVDLELWFESDFEEGEELCVDRISKKGKYEFDVMYKGVY